MTRSLWMLVLLVGCTRTSTVTCEDGITCPQGHVCDMKHAERCVLPDQLRSCAGAANGTTCTIRSEGDGICDQEVCVVERCGDNYTRGDEECDGTDTLPRDCTDFNFYVSQTIGCTADCTYDRRSCQQSCGDGEFQEQFEICEAAVAPTRTCVDYGFGTGVLGCLNCGPDTSECVEFGWRIDDIAGSLFRIHGVSDSEVYGAGVYLYRFDGTTWSVVDTSSCSESVYAEHVWAPAPGVVFGAGGSMVFRLMGGTCTTWSTANGESILDLWASSATDAYVITQAAGVWHFDGATWAQQSGAPPGGALVWGSSADNVYATDMTNSVYRFNGSTWSGPEALAGVGTLFDLWGTAANDVYAAGRDASTPFPRAVVLRFDGADWTPIFDDEPLLRGDTTEIHGGWTVGNRVFVSAYGADSYRQYNDILEHDGTGWTGLDAPVLDASAVWAAPSGQVFATQGFGGKKVLRLPRAVRTDEPDVVRSYSNVRVAARTADQLFVASGGLFGYSDGASWVLEDEQGQINIAYDISLAPTGELFAIGNQGLQLRAGTTWSNVATGFNGEAIVALAADDVWMVTPASSEIKHWTGTGSPASYNYDFDTMAGPAMYDIWGLAPATVFAVGERGSIVRWTGSTIAPMTSGTAEDLFSVWGRSATDVYAAGGSSLVHYDGNAWSPVDVPDGLTIHAVWGTATELFIGTESGLLRHDGQRWMDVATGTASGITAIGGVGDSVLFTDRTGGWHRIVRLNPW